MYCAMIGDLINSKKLPAEDRAAIQERLKAPCESRIVTKHFVQGRGDPVGAAPYTPQAPEALRFGGLPFFRWSRYDQVKATVPL